MRIVPQLASLLYSPFPALPAPRIGGLLTAESSRQPHSHVQRQIDAWATADADIAAFVAGARVRLVALQAELIAEVRCA